jgi:hypothetical protein
VTLIVLGLLAAGFALVQRMRAERSSRAVDVVVDYSEVVALAGRQGMLPMAVLMRLREAGATAVALPEESLESLWSDGEVNITAHPLPFGGKYPAGWLPSDQVFAVDVSNLLLINQVWDGLRRVYPENNLHADSMRSGTLPYRFLVRGPRQDVGQLGLGLSPTKVDTITRAGLRVVPRLRGNDLAAKPALERSIAALAEMMPLPKGAAQRGVVIFDGAALPGYRALIPTLAELLKRHQLVYGAVEFSKQKGDAQLGAKLRGQLVRVHSISAEELATNTTGQAIQRFALAVKDRNIRVLYVHFPPLTSDDPLATAMAYVQRLATTIRHEGFVVDVQRPAHPFAPLSLPTPVLALLFAGSGAGLLLWIVTLLPAALPRRIVLLGYGVLVIGVAGAVGSAVVTPGLGRTLFGLCAAIGFTMLALTWAYRRLHMLADAHPRQAVLPAVGTLLSTTVITALGGLFIAGMMAETPFLVKVGQFSGVKLTLAAPLLLFGALIVTDGVARHGETLEAYRLRCLARLRGFLGQPVYLWGIALATIGLVVVAVALLRSGNDAGVGVSSLELRFRSLLEQWLIARPRTKEFLIGHPVFILAIAAAARGWRSPALLLLLAGAIGQVSVVNTYCHAHTPVLLSLLRTVNGIWLGVIIGLALWLVLGWLTRTRQERDAAPAAVEADAE